MAIVIMVGVAALCYLAIKFVQKMPERDKHEDDG